VELHTNYFEDPQNDKKKSFKLWNFKIVKQKLSKSTRAKPHPPPSHQKIIKNLQNDKFFFENSGTLNMKTKNF